MNLEDGLREFLPEHGLKEAVDLLQEHIDSMPAGDQEIHTTLNSDLGKITVRLTINGGELQDVRVVPPTPLGDWAVEKAKENRLTAHGPADDLLPASGLVSAEFLLTREALGFSEIEFAEFLGVSMNKVKFWDYDGDKVPKRMWDKISALQTEIDMYIGRSIKFFTTNPARGAVPILTWPTDTGLRAEHPECPYPARWHRMICGRIQELIPETRITYDRPDIGEVWDFLQKPEN